MTALRLMLASAAFAAGASFLYGAVLYDKHNDKVIATSEMAGRISGVMQAFHHQAGSFGQGDVTAKVKAFDDQSGPGVSYRHHFGGTIEVTANENRFSAHFEDLTPMACKWMMRFRAAGSEEPFLIGSMLGPAGIGIVATRSPSGCREGDLIVTYEPVPDVGGEPV